METLFSNGQNLTFPESRFSSNPAEVLIFKNQLEIVLILLLVKNASPL